MGKASPALESFNAGELSPDFAARVTNEKYPVGCSQLQNFIPRIQGPARRRPGTRFVNFVKTSTNKTLIRKFIFSQGQAYTIEFGDSYCRFYTNHGQVQSMSAPYEIASPYAQATLFNTDGTPGLQIEQSGDVLYIACGSVWPQTLTRLGATNWVFAPYAPGDGPFLPENSNSAPALYVVPISGSPGQYTCHSTAPIFSASDVATATTPGRLVRINVQWFNIPSWTTDTGITLGVLRRNNGNTYKCLNSSGTTGTNPPVHTNGVAWDGAEVQWLYLDSGYGIGQVIAFTSSTQVTLQVSNLAGKQTNVNANQQYNFPLQTQGIIGPITAITAANPCVVTVSSNPPTAGDPIFLTGVGGMTQITERSFVATAVSGNNVTLGQLDSSGYTAYTSGGSLITNASIDWEIGAWGSPNALTHGSYPTAVCFWEDRLFWGWGIDWGGSAPGSYNSHAEDLFSQVTAACAVRGIIAAQEVDAITWMNPAILLLIGTKGGEFALGPLSASQPLGPGNTSVERQSKFRSRSVKPELINTSNFYVQSSGKKVMAQDFNFYLNRYDSTNQNRLANHIAGYTVSSGFVDAAYHAEPYECLWCLRSDGVLTGYTFDRQDNVTGWHEHRMGQTLAGPAVVESICVIPAPDGTRDELWMTVRRTIGNQIVRSIEYMEKDFETGDAQSSMCYVDMSGVYNGVPTNTVTGLSYLNGESVQILRDGGGDIAYTVAAGAITLSTGQASVVQVGLAAPSSLVTMEIEGGADVGTAQGKVKRPASVVVRVKNMLGALVGAVNTQLSEMQTNLNPIFGQAPPLFTGDIDRVGLNADPIPNCKLQILQTGPFATEVLGIFPAITVNEPSPP